MMSNVLQLGTKALTLQDVGDGRVSVRLASPVNEVERNLEMVLPDFDAAQEYADYIVDRCPGFYGPVLDMTGGANVEPLQ